MQRTWAKDSWVIHIEGERELPADALITLIGEESVYEASVSASNQNEESLPALSGPSPDYLLEPTEDRSALVWKRRAVDGDMVIKKELGRAPLSELKGDLGLQRRHALLTKTLADKAITDSALETANAKAEKFRGLLETANRELEKAAEKAAEGDAALLAKMCALLNAKKARIRELSETAEDSALRRQKLQGYRKSRLYLSFCDYECSVAIPEKLRSCELSEESHLILLNAIYPFLKEFWPVELEHIMSLKPGLHFNGQTEGQIHQLKSCPGRRLSRNNNHRLNTAIKSKCVYDRRRVTARNLVEKLLTETDESGIHIHWENIPGDQAAPIREQFWNIWTSFNNHYVKIC